MTQITNVRYGELGKILFDFAGETIAIKEPIDVILVGQDPNLVQNWIFSHYGFLLSALVK